MVFTFYSIFTRLPDGKKFRDLSKTLVSVILKPSDISCRALKLSLCHFFCGGKYGILIPDAECSISELVYHVSSNENRERILSDGIISNSGLVFVSDCVNEVFSYLNWKYNFKPNHEEINIFTINTRICIECGYNLCKLSRGREFIVKKVPENAIISCENLAQFSFPNLDDN